MTTMEFLIQHHIEIPPIYIPIQLSIYPSIHPSSCDSCIQGSRCSQLSFCEGGVICWTNGLFLFFSFNDHFFSQLKSLDHFFSSFLLPVGSGGCATPSLHSLCNRVISERLNPPPSVLLFVSGGETHPTSSVCACCLFVCAGMQACVQMLHVSCRDGAT